MTSLGGCTGAKKNVGDYNWWVITRLTGCRDRGCLELPLLFSALFLINKQELTHCTRESRQERPPMCMETHVLPVGHEMSTVIRTNLCQHCTGRFFLTPPPAARSHHLSCTYSSFQAAFQTTSINPDQDNQLSASWFRGAHAYTRTGIGRNGPLQHHWEFVKRSKKRCLCSETSASVKWGGKSTRCQAFLINTPHLQEIYASFSSAAHWAAQ